MKIIGVAAYPTGTAHTYTSAEKLEVTARNLDHQIKFETQNIKTENRLSEQEVKEADVIIPVVDKEIELDRFVGKRTGRVPTSRATKEPQVVIDEILRGIGVFVVSNEKEPVANEKKPTIYNCFMNGVNYAPPFMIAGGVIIVLSFAFGVTATDPNSVDYNMLAATSSGIGGDTAFVMMVPTLGAGVATSIIGKAGFAPGIVTGSLASTGGSGFLSEMIGGVLAGCICDFLTNKISVGKEFSAVYQPIVVPFLSILIIGLLMVLVIEQPITWVLDALTNWLNSLGSVFGLLSGLSIGIMMAADMGGPVGKLTSTFSIGLVSAGVNASIAACMVAGMISPLGIALATLLFKHKLTKEERTSGQSCWILGASYITEGTTLFAVFNSIHMISGLMTGSAIAIGISMTVGVTSMAPYGGIWAVLIPDVVNNPPMYALVIASGTVTTAFMLRLSRKTVKKKKQDKWTKNENLTNEVEA